MTLTPEQVIQAFTTIRKGGPDGEKASAIFMYLNQPLVGYVAKRYVDKGLSWAELLDAGNIGMLQALNRFDHLRGNMWSTFAVPWIAGEIKQRFKSTKQEKESDKAVRATEYGVPLVDNDGATLSVEVSEKVQVTIEPPIDEQNIDSDTGCAEFSASLRGEDASEDPIPSRGLTINFVPDRSTGLMSVDVNLIPALEHALEKLEDPRQVMVLAMRLGLRGYQQHTPFSEIGKALGVSAQRAHDIQQQVFATLRKDPTLQLLFEQTL